MYAPIESPGSMLPGDMLSTLWTSERREIASSTNASVYVLDTKSINPENGTTEAQGEDLEKKPIEKVVVKEVFLEEDSDYDKIRQEIETMKKCGSNPFIVSYYFDFPTLSSVSIGMEHCSHGDLFDRLYNAQEAMDEETKRTYILEIVLALGHLHDLDIVHGDIKPENIGIGKDNHIRLLDFGMSVILSEGDYNPATGNLERVTTGGTLTYCAPEKLRRRPHGVEIDWWSVGVLIYEMFALELPWYHEREAVTCQMIQTHPLPPLHQFGASRCVYDLVNGLLQKDKDDRLCNQTDILCHMFFSWVFSPSPTTNTVRTRTGRRLRIKSKSRIERIPKPAGEANE
eukprot:CAMPEP_0203760506 /NCGR_PEP_ID=MMETSP0098-20131031/13780_1 /ASSEMBLY_ACC=CAM_ASM_000208 /TAXON_ID=96639 /ORGANISM=" , Strain NY0313808BC1" /LENGTH=342 /DNA_ID=CAMNT_0050654089 /DNA_START=431 /DNA_END=1459 /DNA_ORIENTATION=+